VDDVEAAEREAVLKIVATSWFIRLEDGEREPSNYRRLVAS
jgi:hypothetical protein